MPKGNQYLANNEYFIRVLKYLAERDLTNYTGVHFLL